MISSLNSITLVPIERKITDLRKCTRSFSTLEAYDDDQDANTYYQLESLKHEFRKKMLEAGSLKESDVITLETTLMAVKQDSNERKSYVELLEEVLLLHIKSKLVEIMRKFSSVHSRQTYLRDEICTHGFECQQKSREFVGHADVLQTVKAYVQGNQYTIKRYCIAFIPFGQAVTFSYSVMTGGKSSCLLCYCGRNSSEFRRFRCFSPDLSRYRYFIDILIN